MAVSVSKVLFFILSCGLWVAEARKYNSVLTVPNGGRWGLWGRAEFCSTGHAVGFRIKVEPYGPEYDLTALNAIALLCDDGKTITSAAAPWGIWQKEQYCRQGQLVSFALRVQEAMKGDNTAANNIKFRCSDNTLLMGNGNPRGEFGSGTNRCTKGSICGIQTRVQPPQLEADDTALNDVKMFCCD